VQVALSGLALALDAGGEAEARKLFAQASGCHARLGPSGPGA